MQSDFKLIAACSPISKELKRDVNPAVTMAQLVQNPEKFRGETVLLGGRIINSNVKKNETVLEILHFPLDYQDRPDPSIQSEGRFLVTYDRYLDPAIFAAGRAVTVVGRVAGVQTGYIGPVEYAYPVVAGRTIHLWREQIPGPPAVTFGIGIGTRL